MSVQQVSPFSTGDQSRVTRNPLDHADNHQTINYSDARQSAAKPQNIGHKNSRKIDGHIDGKSATRSPMPTWGESIKKARDLFGVDASIVACIEGVPTGKYTGLPSGVVGKWPDARELAIYSLPEGDLYPLDIDGGTDTLQALISAVPALGGTHRSWSDPTNPDRCVLWLRSDMPIRKVTAGQSNHTIESKHGALQTYAGTHRKRGTSYQNNGLPIVRLDNSQASQLNTILDRLAPIPKPIPIRPVQPRASGSERELEARRYDGAINTLIDQLASHSATGRHTAQTKIGAGVGGLLHKATITETQAIEYLLQAMTTNGYVNDRNRANVRRSIVSSVDHGMKNPRELEDRALPARRSQAVAVQTAVQPTQAVATDQPQQLPRVKTALVALAPKWLPNSLIQILRVILFATRWLTQAEIVDQTGLSKSVVSRTCNLFGVPFEVVPRNKVLNQEPSVLCGTTSNSPNFLAYYPKFEAALINGILADRVYAEAWRKTRHKLPRMNAYLLDQHPELKGEGSAFLEARATLINARLEAKLSRDELAAWDAIQNEADQMLQDIMKSLDNSDVEAAPVDWKQALAESTEITIQGVKRELLDKLGSVPISDRTIKRHLESERGLRPVYQPMLEVKLQGDQAAKYVACEGGWAVRLAVVDTPEGKKAMYQPPSLYKPKQEITAIDEQKIEHGQRRAKRFASRRAARPDEQDRIIEAVELAHELADIPLSGAGSKKLIKVARASKKTAEDDIELLPIVCTRSDQPEEWKEAILNRFRQLASKSASELRLSQTRDRLIDGLLADFPTMRVVTDNRYMPTTPIHNRYLA